MVRCRKPKAPMGKIVGIADNGTEIIVYVDKIGQNIVLQTISKSHIIRPLSGKNTPDSWVIEAQEIFALKSAMYAPLLN